MIRLRHGWYGTPEYQAWQDMKRRCYDKRRRSYRHYGGRGIIVCERWHSFENFIADMGAKPTSDHSLDRKDTNGNYEPDNCRWATEQEQGRNKRNNAVFTIDGITKTQIEWLNQAGIAKSTFNNRIKRGWAVSMALFTPIDPMKRNSYAKEKQ